MFPPQYSKPLFIGNSGTAAGREPRSESSPRGSAVFVEAWITATHPAAPVRVLNRADAMRARMDEYGVIARRSATCHGKRFLDTQAAFDAVLAHAHSASLAWDRVHPQPAGHMIPARAFLAEWGAL
ncbi:MAG: hypothetical protein NTU80_05900 [Verrucomicrobia bacterium]|nr:hypothetical protein [Verrucomicrobiota bacterium]